MSVSQIERDERLGRAVFSSRVKKRLEDYESVLPWKLLEGDFSSAADSNDVSMDRLDKADCIELTKIQDASGRRRKPPRTFYGWAHCPASVFQDRGWETHASPILEPSDGLLPNPYHSHIRVDNSGREGALEVLKAGIGRWEWQERCDPE